MEELQRVFNEVETKVTEGNESSVALAVVVTEDGGFISYKGTTIALAAVLIQKPDLLDVLKSAVNVADAFNESNE